MENDKQDRQLMSHLQRTIPFFQEIGERGVNHTIRLPSTVHLSFTTLWYTETVKMEVEKKHKTTDTQTLTQT